MERYEARIRLFSAERQLQVRWTLRRWERCGSELV
jgi:hypothetical protein